MKYRFIETNGLTVLTHSVTIFWLVTLFLVFALQWLDGLFFMLALSVVPILALGAWVFGVPIWLLWIAVSKSCRRQWPEALQCLAAFPIAAAIAFAGLKCGDLIAVMTYGSLLRNEVEAVKTGAVPKNSNGLFSSSMMAFKLTGGFLDLSTGIAYDSSGMAEAMLAMPPSARPRDWQNKAVDVLICQGRARHLFGHFYQINVSGYSC